MAILNEELTNVNLNKMKFYRNENLLNIDLLQKNCDIKKFYKSANLLKIEEYKNNLISNLKVINKNFENNILTIEKNLKKYQDLKVKTEKLMKNIGAVYDK